MSSVAHELSFGDLYFSPILLLVLLSFVLTGLTTLLLNKFKISQYIFYPRLAFIAIMILYITLIDTYFIHI